MRLIDADFYIKYCKEHWVPLNEDIVKIQPTINAFPVIPAKIKDWRCSNCNIGLPILNVENHNGIVWQYVGEMKYCPNCGAKLNEEVYNENNG